MALKVFIDTEFTDFTDSKLISLGMAAETGEDFYVEVPFLENDCSEFVKDIVIPMLGKVPHAFCDLDSLRIRILSWLSIVRQSAEPLEICFDFETDWNLFREALDFRIPEWCKPRLVAENINELLYYDFFERNDLREHHALHDAQANRYAFRE